MTTHVESAEIADLSALASETLEQGLGKRIRH
jgi:hypothetical protein